MWEVSLEAGSGKPAVMRNAGGARVLVKTCASVEEAEALIATLNENLREGAKGTSKVAKRVLADGDDNANTLIQALDAVLDEACDLVQNVAPEGLPEEVAQAIAMLFGAESIVDDLMDLMGLYDADDDDAEKSKAKPKAKKPNPFAAFLKKKKGAGNGADVPPKKGVKADDDTAY